MSCSDAPRCISSSANAHRLVVNHGSAEADPISLWHLPTFYKKTAFFFGNSEKTFIFAPS